ncbi:MAG: radical SAM protein [bacterium]
MKIQSYGKTGKALIVNPPAVVERDFIDYPYFANLGALQHASAIAAEGFDVNVLDSFSLPGSDVFPLDNNRFLAGCQPEELASLSVRLSFDSAIVCVSVFNRPFAHDDCLAAFFRNFRKLFPDTPIAAADAYFGGMHYVDYSGEVFLNNYPEVDVLMRYETEAAAVKWLKNIHSEDARERRVIVGKITENPDKMPFPSWNLINVKYYIEFLNRFFKSTGRRADFADIMPVLPVVTSRGCLYNCSFCSGTAISQRRTYRRISTERMQEELESLKSKYDIAGIAVLDGLANADPDDFAKTLETFQTAGLKVSFVNGLRADRLKKSHVKTLSLISPSLTVSAESASGRIRNGILKKRLDLSSISKAAAWCAEYGLPMRVHYMIGVPGETIAEVNTTLEYARALSAERRAEPLIQFCVPLPGSSLRGKFTSEGGKDLFEASNYFDFFSEGLDSGGEAGLQKIRRMLHSFRMRMRESEPEKLIINLTYRCNNKCVMCAVGGRPKRNMSFEACSELMSEYSRRGVTMLDLDGGEPTLHPDLLRIIGTARALGYNRINVTTNGRKLASRDFASRLLLSGISDLHISVYGHDAESHESVTGVAGSFGETALGIRNAVRLKPERVGFCANTILTAGNYTRLPALMEWLAGLGVLALDIQFPTPFGAAQESCLPPFDKAIMEFEKAASEFRSVLKINLINLPPCRMPLGWPESRADAEKYGRHMAFVNAPVQSLGSYLASKRRRVPECLDCEYYIICEGFYVFD